MKFNSLNIEKLFSAQFPERNTQNQFKRKNQINDDAGIVSIRPNKEIRLFANNINYLKENKRIHNIQK